jgi:hypothetical protein
VPASSIDLKTALAYSRALSDFASELEDDKMLTLVMNTQACLEDHHIRKKAAAYQSKISTFLKHE